ncbi:hypothetical protein KY341_03090, partial [Candidatus Woesearchaeota archaeon]|nr:hypothetical protein [Candidatus Woesearchaeota archaeon]
TKRFAEFIHSLPEDSKMVYKNMEKADLTLEQINKDLQGLTKELRVETFRVIMAMIIASLIIGASLTYRTDAWLSNSLIALALLLLIYVLFTIIRDGLRKRKQ